MLLSMSNRYHAGATPRQNGPKLALTIEADENRNAYESSIAATSRLPAAVRS
jgi:hypothetical protein